MKKLEERLEEVNNIFNWFMIGSVSWHNFKKDIENIIEDIYDDLPEDSSLEE